LVVIATALAAIVAGSLTTMVVRHLTSSSADSRALALPHQEAVERGLAAGWIAQQVNPTDLVSCDPVMCAALRADGFPSSKLQVLGMTSEAPTNSAVVVVTAAVRGMFGSSLGSAWAPAILASFGSGTAEITVRQIAPNGALAYSKALDADLALRKASEAGLLTSPRITLSGPAKEQLAAGEVDSRLVLSLADLAAYKPIDIIGFGNPGPGATADTPLRFADLAVPNQAVDMASPAYLQAMHVHLNQQDSRYRPAGSGKVALPGGKTAFRVEFTAPSPLGLFSGQRFP
jgi:hypothetical protein